VYRKCILTLIVAALLGPMAGLGSAELVGHWRMNEGAGAIAYDTSGYGNDGALQGGPTWTTGRMGGALQLDGVDDFVEIPHAASLTVNSEVTVMAWICPTSYTGPNGSSYQGIVAKSNSPRSYSLYLQSDAVLHFSTNGIGTTSTKTVPLNEWVHVAAEVIDGGHLYFINGQIAGSGGSGITLPGSGDTSSVVIGKTWETDREFAGKIDDVRIYNTRLNDAAVVDAMNNDIPFATALPLVPADGAMIGETQFVLKWKAGDFATSHQVYFGESFEAVDTDQATPITTTAASLDVSLIPGYEAGLTPGTTYYWRVDEIAEGNADSPWTGEVWSFTVQPLTAWGAAPANGATFVRLDQDLTWSAGIGAIFHNVYFGASYDEVANAVEPTSQSVEAALDFEAFGIALEAGKTYYWRVDEFAPMGITQGEVWSFSTVPVIPITDARLVGYWGFDEGVSDTAVDSSGYAHHGVLSGDIVRTEGYFGGALEFGAGRVVDCGEAALNVTGDFTLAAWVKLNPGNAGVYGGIAGKLHYATNYYGFGIVRHSGNAFRLWVGDGTTDLAKSAVSSDVTYTDTDWHHVAGVHNGLANTLYVDGVKQGATTNISFVPSSQFFHIGRQYSSQTDRTFPGLIDEVRVYDKASTDAEIATIMLGNTKLAAAPSPTNGFEVDIRNISELSWSAGTSAVSHDVYLGTDRDTVAKADHSSPEFKGNQAGTTFSVADVVAFGSGTFCWRIDEVAADGAVYTGYVWSFSVPAYLIVDNFETYTNDMDAEETIFDAWVDGLTDSLSTSVVGHEAVPFAEQAIVHGGRQAMPFYYNNANSPYFAEAVYTFDGAQDWTAEGVTTLTLAVRGKADNVASTLYVALADSSKTVAIKNADTSLLTTETWTTWTIPLSEFGVKITAIKKMYLGVGDRANPTPGGAGLVYIDDIRLVK
jgi:hypothetical protein